KVASGLLVLECERVLPQLTRGDHVCPTLVVANSAEFHRARAALNRGSGPFRDFDHGAGPRTTGQGTATKSETLPSGGIITGRPGVSLPSASRALTVARPGGTPCISQVPSVVRQLPITPSASRRSTSASATEP